MRLRVRGERQAGVILTGGRAGVEGVRRLGRRQAHPRRGIRGHETSRRDCCAPSAARQAGGPAVQAHLLTPS